MVPKKLDREYCKKQKVSKRKKRTLRQANSVNSMKLKYYKDNKSQI